MSALERPLESAIVKLEERTLQERFNIHVALAFYTVLLGAYNFKELLNIGTVKIVHVCSCVNQYLTKLH